MGRTRVGFQNQLGEGIHVGLFFPLDFRLSKGRAKAISRTASLANCKGIEAVFPRLSVADRPNPCEGIRPFAPKVVVLLFRLSPSEQVASHTQSRNQVNHILRGGSLNRFDQKTPQPGVHR